MHTDHTIRRARGLKTRHITGKQVPNFPVDHGRKKMVKPTGRVPKAADAIGEFLDQCINTVQESGKIRHV